MVSMNLFLTAAAAAAAVFPVIGGEDLSTECRLVRIEGSEGYGVGYGNILNGLIESTALSKACNLPLEISKVHGLTEIICRDAFVCDGLLDEDRSIPLEEKAQIKYALFSAAKVLQGGQNAIKNCMLPRRCHLLANTSQILYDFFRPRFHIVPSLTCIYASGKVSVEKVNPNTIFFDATVHMRVLAEDYENGEHTPLAEVLDSTYYDDLKWKKYAGHLAHYMIQHQLTSTFIAANIAAFRTIFISKLQDQLQKYQNTKVCFLNQTYLAHNAQIKNNALITSKWSSFREAQLHILNEWYLLSRAKHLSLGSKFYCNANKLKAADCQVDSLDPYIHSTFHLTATRLATSNGLQVAALASDGFYFNNCSNLNSFKYSLRPCWKRSTAF